MIKTIKKLAILELILFVAVFSALFVTESYLPFELQEYLASTHEADIETTYLVAALILVVVFLVYVVSLFGLLATKLWARKAYIYSTIIMFPPLLLMGPTVDHAISYTLDQVSVLVQGMLLAVLLFNSSYQETALNKALKQGRA